MTDAFAGAIRRARRGAAGSPAGAGREWRAASAARQGGRHALRQRLVSRKSRSAHPLYDSPDGTLGVTVMAFSGQAVTHSMQAMHAGSFATKACLPPCAAAFSFRYQGNDGSV